MTPEGFTRPAKGLLVSRSAGPPPPARRYDWLAEPKGRRSALVRVEQAVRNGWDIDEAGRADLVRGLSDLLKSADVPPREKVRVCRIFVAMGVADLAVEDDAGAP